MQLPNPLPLLLLLLLLAPAAHGGGPYGLAARPPMGWSSWNFFGCSVSQDIMAEAIAKTTARVRTVDGVPTSLADLGYTLVSLDDCWQACGEGVNGSFHDAHGVPLVNLSKFPSLKNMTALAHSVGVRMSFYMNNCMCRETAFRDKAFIESVYEQSVAFLVENGFDGVKLDSCSQFHDTERWAQLMNATGRPMLVENCFNTLVPVSGDEWGGSPPFNWFRTFSDVKPYFEKIFLNLQSTLPYLGTPPLAHPGCWAYPDMLEVGNLAAFEESRTHFGAWCIVSSPLILGHDITNDTITDAVWEIIANKEAIAVNQNWAGSPGRLVRSWFPSTPPPPVLGSNVYATLCNASDPTQGAWRFVSANHSIVGPTNHCLDASNVTQLQLLPCDSASPAQNFTYGGADLLGFKEIKNADGLCLEVFEGEGFPPTPLVQLAQCSGSNNQIFAFGLEHAALRSSEDMCLVARSEMPLVSNIMQVWAKPQPEGAVAVFVLANLDAPAGSHATVDSTCRRPPILDGARGCARHLGAHRPRNICWLLCDGHGWGSRQPLLPLHTNLNMQEHTCE
jgi:hypothetical protein